MAGVTSKARAAANALAPAAGPKASGIQPSRSSRRRVHMPKSKHVPTAAACCRCHSQQRGEAC
ncbi:hypothetical protein HaLaN_27167 [Haematococcus lacustris]|uniref:Uncharacterized protein n=1 Tax=Haematococcus lacustris TaxID=44745 RepID=A0A6A0A7P3_HAELA|nr:hypothetical protein HaLaN_27167 [Haematococcus lacustris]